MNVFIGFIINPILKSLLAHIVYTRVTRLFWPFFGIVPFILLLLLTQKNETNTGQSFELEDKLDLKAAPNTA